VAGAAYHVNIKAVTGARAFPDSLHRDYFLQLLRTELAKSRWTCLGYTVLGTHYHLAIRLEKCTLSSGFQRLNSSYSRWFNRKHGRTGALWQSRFYDVAIESDFQLLELQRYFAYNATRASLTEAPEDWPYCHYGALIGLHPPDRLVAEDEILRLLSPNRRRARQRLREYVEENDPRRRRQTIV
jgi:REP-associated tyrosine transposase